MHRLSYFIWMAALGPFLAGSQEVRAEQMLATGFVYPVLGYFTTEPKFNTHDLRVDSGSTECTADSDKWFVDGNDFGNHYCAPGCSEPNCYHPGEDWNICPNPTEADEGKNVYSIANGRVVGRNPVMSDNTRGWYLTIEYQLPRTENTSAYILPDTTAPDPGTFPTINASYLHINQPTLQTGDLVEKGDLIGTISTCCSHLHFEIKTSGTNVSNCAVCGYCNSEKDLTENYYLDPTLFLGSHLNDLTIFPVGSISSGNVRISGPAGSFGNTQGQGSVTLKVFTSATTSTEIVPQIKSWGDTAIEINIFSSSDFRFAQFKLPIQFVIRRDNTTVPLVGHPYYPFDDVKPDAWFADEVVSLWKNGVVKGKAKTIYYTPGDKATRAEFITMAVLASNRECSWWNPFDCPSAPPFNDVTDPTSWFYPFVKAAYNRGWLTYDDAHQSFRPGDPINRAEVAAILVKALGKAEETGSAASLFDDVTNPQDWFYNPVYLCRDLGIFAGYPRGKNCDGQNDPGKTYFCPAKATNRAEAAKVIYEAFLR